MRVLDAPCLCQHVVFSVVFVLAFWWLCSGISLRLLFDFSDDQ